MVELTGVVTVLITILSVLILLSKILQRTSDIFEKTAKAIVVAKVMLNVLGTEFVVPIVQYIARGFQSFAEISKSQYGQKPGLPTRTFLGGLSIIYNYAQLLVILGFVLTTGLLLAVKMIVKGDWSLGILLPGLVAFSVYGIGIGFFHSRVLDSHYEWQQIVKEIRAKS